MRAALPRLLSIAAPILVGAAYFTAAWLSLALTQGADGIATIWPASGILLAALLKAPRGTEARFLAAAMVASLAANLIGSVGIGLSVCFTVANLAEALFATALLRRWCGDEPSFLKLADVGKFCAATAIAAVASAVIAASISRGGQTMLISWFSTDMLGMWIVTPLILMVISQFRDRADPMLRANRISETVLLLALVTSVTVATFAQSAYPVFFLPMVALVAATYRLGPSGAAAGLLIIVTTSSALTGLGHGPLMLIERVNAPNAALFLQFYFVALFATALPLAALLAARAKLMVQCADSEAMYRLMADNSSDMIVRIGLDGVRRYISPACRAILGYAPEELIGVGAAGAIHPDDRVRTMDVCRTLMEGAISPICVYRQAHANGTFVWLEATYTLVTDPGTGQPIEFIASVRDVSRRQEAELAVSESTARLQEGYRLLSMAERAANVGHWRLDVIGGTLLWSTEIFRIHGLEEPNTPALKDAINAYHPDDREMAASHVQKAIDQATGFEFAARIVRPDGEIRHIVSRGQAEVAPNGDMLAVFGVIQDVTRQHEVECQLETARRVAEDATRLAIKMAETDDLTGVANRRRSLTTLANAIHEASSSGSPLSLAIFDIDHFKRVNDLFGHGVGDEVLRRVAKSASASVRPSDLVGRIGGEEFVVLLPGADTTLALSIAERVRISIETAGGAGSAVPNVTASFGVATFTSEMTAAMLMQVADGALYEAKAAGRNRLRLAA